MDRLIRAFEALVRLFTSELARVQTTLYSVVSCNPIAQTVQVRSLDPEVSDLTELPMSTPGLILNLPPGTIVKVGYAGTQPYVCAYSSGGLQPLPPGAGSGVLNEIDAGYVLITQVLQPIPSVVTAVYFPAGVSGGIAAQAALLVATTAGLGAFLLHMNGGRVLPTAWTVP